MTQGPSRSPVRPHRWVLTCFSQCFRQQGLWLVLALNRLAAEAAPSLLNPHAINQRLIFRQAKTGEA